MMLAGTPADVFLLVRMAGNIYDAGWASWQRISVSLESWMVHWMALLVISRNGWAATSVVHGTTFLHEVL